MSSLQTWLTHKAFKEYLPENEQQKQIMRYGFAGEPEPTEDQYWYRAIREEAGVLIFSARRKGFEPSECCIPLESLRQMGYQFVAKEHGCETSTPYPASALLVHYFKLNAVKSLLLTLTHGSFRKNFQKRNQQIFLLGRLIEVFAETAKNRNEFDVHSVRDSAYSLLIKVHGRRIKHRPEAREIITEFSFHLDSLVGLGALAKFDQYYSLSTDALNIYISRLEEEQRHRDASRQGCAMICLTVVIALATIVQAASQWRAIKELLTAFFLL